MDSSEFGKPKSFLEGLEQGARWILDGGNIMTLVGKLGDIPVEVIIKDIRNPLIVWRVRPQFEHDTDKGITYLRVRLEIPGSHELQTLGNVSEDAQARGDHESAVLWCEGVEL